MEKNYQMLEKKKMNKEQSNHHQLKLDKKKPSTLKRIEEERKLREKCLKIEERWLQLKEEQPSSADICLFRQLAKEFSKKLVIQWFIHKTNENLKLPASKN